MAFHYLHEKYEFGANLPIEDYLEIEVDRWETRKVEVFADGRLHYCDGLYYTGITGLSENQIPSVAELNRIDGVTAREIDADEFERIWDRALAEPFEMKQLG